MSLTLADIPTPFSKEDKELCRLSCQLYDLEGVLDGSTTASCQM